MYMIVYTHDRIYMYHYAAFELSSGRVVTRVYVTSTGDKVYGIPREQDKGNDKNYSDRSTFKYHSTCSG